MRLAPPSAPPAVRPRARQKKTRTQAADDAVVGILGRLEAFRGGSRFTTWACKFAILEASEALRKRLWKRRELPLADDWWRSLALSAADPEEEVEQLEVLHELRGAVEQALTEQQREVFVALALNGVPVDVIAARLGTTCGAVYKALHDARRKLRARLGLSADAITTAAGAELVREEPTLPRREPTKCEVAQLDCYREKYCHSGGMAFC